VSSPIRLVVGLGNPGPQYARTRHNAGFWFVDALAAWGGGSFRPASRFSSEVAEIAHAGERVRLLRPATYMNRSGSAVAPFVRFYRYPVEQVLIAHDEIDLPAGGVRLKRSGGHAGHNGLRDIIAQLGDPGFARLRIGVGHPGDSRDVVGYVLSRPSPDEETHIRDAIERVLEAMPEILAGDLERAMSTLHRKVE